MNCKQQSNLFGDAIKKEWQMEWEGMPEFVQEKQVPFAQIIFRFETEKDLKEFSKLIGQKLSKKTKSAWFPFKSHFTDASNIAYVEK
jgi:hypothetical protein